MAVPRTGAFSPFGCFPGRVPIRLQNRKREDQMAKSVQELMTSNPCSIDSDKSVVYAAKMMRDENVGLAPIVEGNRLIGTVTDRDIATRVVAEDKDPASTKVTDIASTDLVTVDPQ